MNAVRTLAHSKRYYQTADRNWPAVFLSYLPTVCLFLSRLFSLRRKRQSMIKLPCNKCNGCISSSSHRLKSAGALKSTICTSALPTGRTPLAPIGDPIKHLQPFAVPADIYTLRAGLRALPGAVAAMLH